MGWGGFLDKLFEKLPIQGRVERWKNEVDRLVKERAEILIHKADVKFAKRLDYIDRRIVYLNGLLKNKAI